MIVVENSDRPFGRDIRRSIGAHRRDEGKSLPLDYLLHFIRQYAHAQPPLSRRQVSTGRFGHPSRDRAKIAVPAQVPDELRADGHAFRLE
jgi:hypothetical protein